MTTDEVCYGCDKPIDNDAYTVEYDADKFERYWHDRCWTERYDEDGHAGNGPR